MALLEMLEPQPSAIESKPLDLTYDLHLSLRAAALENVTTPGGQDTDLLPEI